MRFGKVSEVHSKTNCLLRALGAQQVYPIGHTGKTKFGIYIKKT